MVCLVKIFYARPRNELGWMGKSSLRETFQDFRSQLAENRTLIWVISSVFLRKAPFPGCRLTVPLCFTKQDRHWMGKIPQLPNVQPSQDGGHAVFGPHPQGGLPVPLLSPRRLRTPGHHHRCEVGMVERWQISEWVLEFYDFSFSSKISPWPPELLSGFLFRITSLKCS